MVNKDEHPSIFRQTSLSRLASPEHVDDYLCLPTPSIALLVLGFVLLVVGMTAWFLMGGVGA